MMAAPSCGAMTTAHAAHAMLAATTSPDRLFPSFVDPSDDGVLRASSGVSDLSFSRDPQLSLLGRRGLSTRGDTTATTLCSGVCAASEVPRLLVHMRRISRMNVLVNIPETRTQSHVRLRRFSSSLYFSTLNSLVVKLHPHSLNVKLNFLLFRCISSCNC